jgi:hypothetical protein
MNNASITKVNNNIAACNEGYSLGFKRFHHLPRRVSQAMQKAALIDGTALNKVHKKCVNFLQGLNDKEFQNWMVLA